MSDYIYEHNWRLFQSIFTFWELNEEGDTGLAQDLLDDCLPMDGIVVKEDNEKDTDVCFRN